MYEPDALVLSIAAQKLIFDLANGCAAMRIGRRARCVTMRRPGGPALKTQGQVDDSAVEELAENKLVHFFGETFPQPFGLTPFGEAYYERFLKNASTQL